MMAKCYECGDDLSSAAHHCPHCGYYYSHAGVTRGTNVRRPNGDWGESEWKEDIAIQRREHRDSGGPLKAFLKFIIVWPLIIIVVLLMIASGLHSCADFQ